MTDTLKRVKSAIRKIEKDDVGLDVEWRNQTVESELSYLLRIVQLCKERVDLEFPSDAERSLFQTYKKAYAELVSKRINLDVQIDQVPSEPFYTSNKSTHIASRDKLEITIKRLCFLVGIARVEKALGARESWYYRPAGFAEFQSAANTILDLSEKLIIERK